MAKLEIDTYLNMDFIIPLIIGFFGSLYCIGQFRPIMVSIPLKEKRSFPTAINSILFLSGRIFIYSGLGIIFGMLGRGLLLAGFQQLTSILLGSAIIISVLYPAIFRQQINLNELFYGFVARQAISIKNQVTDRSYLSIVKVGIMSSLLPCCLVLLAIAVAISTGSIWTGSIYMVLFGIGTIPLLLIINLERVEIGQKIRLKMRVIAPFFVFMLGLLFILRGLSLGIPFISPNLVNPPHHIIINKGSCC